jgi:predicted restriction endonuclease
MNTRRNWTREELILAINLYCKTPFGKIHNRNPEIIRFAKLIDRTASSVSYKLANFASIDPSLPREGASHFSKLDAEVWEDFFGNGEDFAYRSELLLAEYEQNDLTESTEIAMPTNTESERKVKTRINQAFFRKTILATYNFKCCVTNIAIPELLVASHIIPWAKDKKNRLNPRNGLCLNALQDKAFDKGLISLSDDYRIILSGYLRDNCIDDFARNSLTEFENTKITLPNRFLPDKEFIRYHQENVFLG